jgi:hypothetical protein
VITMLTSPIAAALMQDAVARSARSALPHAPVVRDTRTTRSAPRRRVARLAAVALRWAGTAARAALVRS